MNEEANVLNEGLYYTTVEGFELWISKNFAGILSSDVPNDVTPNLDKIKEALMSGEGMVDGYLRSSNYTVPVPPESKRALALLKTICYSLAAYELYTIKGTTQESYYKYNESIKVLQRIASGEIYLDIPEAGGKVESGTMFHAEFSYPEAVLGLRIDI